MRAAPGTMRRALAAGLVLLAAGCATLPPPPPPLPPGALRPELRGTWSGTWAGAPVSLVVTEQDDYAMPAGVLIGPWSLAGRRPGVGGVLTFSLRGQQTSANARGWLGGAARAPALVVVAEVADGTVALDLRAEPDGRLRGVGTSSFAWGPRGPVELRPVSGGRNPGP